MQIKQTLKEALLACAMFVAIETLTFKYMTHSGKILFVVLGILCMFALAFLNRE